MNENNNLDIEQSPETGELDSGSVQTDSEAGNEVEDTPTAYVLSDGVYGTISDTYLDYFEGVVQKLPPDEHYVIWKSGDYEYTLAYGDEITENDGSFYGECDTVTIYRDNSSSYNTNWYVERGSDSLSLNASKLFVYSDLGMYPTIERGVSALEANTILFTLGFAVVYSVCHDLFDYVLGHLRR